MSDAQTISFFDITDLRNDGDALNNFARRLGLLPAFDQTLDCIVCGGNGTLRLEVERARADGYRWVCRRGNNVAAAKKKPKICTHSAVYSNGTLFSNLHLERWQYLAFVWLFLRKSSMEICVSLSQISKKTFTAWIRELGLILEKALLKGAPMIGGVGHIVEIDESLFGKRKYNRGHRVHGVWIFGGIDRTTGEMFALPVEKRNAAALTLIIKHFIKPGTTIHSDMWAAYRKLADAGFVHATVNHSVEFKAPDGTHTNTIESIWRHMKACRSTHGKQWHLIAGRLALFMLRHRCTAQNLDLFDEFCRAARQIFNFKTPAPLEHASSTREIAYNKLLDDLDAAYGNNDGDIITAEESAEDEISSAISSVDAGAIDNYAEDPDWDL